MEKSCPKPNWFLIECRIHGSINYGKSPGPEAAEQPQTITLPPPCLTVGMMFFLWNACWFYARCNGTRPSKRSTFVTSAAEYLPKVWWYQDIVLLYVLLVSNVFCLGTLPWMPFFAQSLAYCWSHEHWLNWGKWGLQFFRYCSGFFYDFMESCRCSLWVILVGRPLLGGSPPSKVFSFVDNGSDRGFAGVPKP